MLVSCYYNKNHLEGLISSDKSTALYEHVLCENALLPISCIQQHVSFM